MKTYNLEEQNQKILRYSYFIEDCTVRFVKVSIELEDLLGDFDKRREGSCCEVWTMRNARLSRKDWDLKECWLRS
jgi:hypothetical protein